MKNLQRLKKSKRTSHKKLSKIIIKYRLIKNFTSTSKFLHLLQTFGRNHCVGHEKGFAAGHRTAFDRYTQHIIKSIVFIALLLVIPVLYEPLPGWVDSLNGPIGLLVGAGKGVIRTMLVDEKNHAEVIPVDIVANALISMAWYRGTRT